MCLEYVRCEGLNTYGRRGSPTCCFHVRRVLLTEFLARISLESFSELEYAEGIGLKNLAPHDLRRTCAKLCRKSGGDLEQIQMLLGHASIQTTEKYLGMQQNLVEAVNDKLGIVDANE